MNRNATAFLLLLLASGLTLASWEFGWNGPTYARVLRATAVTVREPRYADVVDAVPIPPTAAPTAAPAGAKPAPPRAWDVAYRQGRRVLHTRSASDPGDQVRIGEQRRVIGYDVVWRWRERTGTVRLDRRPGKRLPVEDGAVVAVRRPFPLSG